MFFFFQSTASRNDYERYIKQQRKQKEKEGSWVKRDYKKIKQNN